VPDFCVFHGEGVNEPTAQKAGWVIQHLRDGSRCPDASALTMDLGRQVFRKEIFNQAVHLRKSTPPSNDNESKSDTELASA